ncbi:MAG: hypothetical protein KDC04_01505 [Saprospiraceae bacterium]|nr:hypothetical protein [Saprospiraceae bacterium]
MRENLIGQWEGTVDKITTFGTDQESEVKSIVVEFSIDNQVSFENFPFKMQFIYQCDPEKIGFFKEFIFLGGDIPPYVDIIKNSNDEQIWETSYSDFVQVDSTFKMATVFQTYNLKKR